MVRRKGETLKLEEKTKQELERKSAEAATCLLFEFRCSSSWASAPYHGRCQKLGCFSGLSKACRFRVCGGTYSALIKHIRGHYMEAGFECLKNIGKGLLNGILSKSNIKPHKMSYYLEKRDPEFEEKMANVLHIYKEVTMINANDIEAEKQTTLSYDEKSGIH